MAVTSRTEPAACEGVRSQDPLERRHEHLADVEDRGHEGVGLSRVEQEQHDARPDDDLDEPEDEDHDAAGRSRRHRGPSVVMRRLSVCTVSWPVAVGSWVVTTVRST